MIGDPANLVVRTGFPRLSAAEIAPFRERSTSFDVDAVDGRGALDHAIEPLDPNSRQRAHGAGLRARQPGGARGPRPDRAGRRPGDRRAGLLRHRDAATTWPGSRGCAAPPAS